MTNSQFTTLNNAKQQLIEYSRGFTVYLCQWCSFCTCRDSVVILICAALFLSIKARLGSCRGRERGRRGLHR